MMKRQLRLVSTSPDNTEILCALGAIDDLVGISRHCDYPDRIQDEKPVVSDFAKANIQTIVDLKPDIVFCSTYYQAGMVQALVENHLRVFVSQPSTLASVYENIQLMAQLIDRPERGRMLVDHIQENLQPQPSTGLKVFAEEWGDPIVYAAPWIQELISLAGGVPVLPEKMAYTHTNQRIVDPADVVAAQPDMILLPWCGCHGKVPVEKVTGRSGWDRIPAVRQGRVYPVEDSLFVRPGPRLIQGYKLLAALLHDPALTGVPQA